MHRSAAVLCFTAAWTLFAPSRLLAEEPPDFSRGGGPFVKKHCVACHGGKRPKADLSLEGLRDSTVVARRRKLMEKAVRMIQAGEMPPEGRPRPSAAEIAVFVDSVRLAFDYADRHAKPDPGRVTMCRLNRAEYRNTIRDLIGVDFDPTEDFPSDDIGHGFDNIGDVLTLSPVLMERYLAAAESIMRRAITPNPPPPPKRHLSTRYSEPASPHVGKKAIVGKFRRLATDGAEIIETGPINTPYQWEDDGEYIFRTRVYARAGKGQKVRMAVLVTGKELADATPEAQLDKLAGRTLKPAKLLKTFVVEASEPDKAEVVEVRVPPMPGRHRMQVGVFQLAEGEPPVKLFVEYLALEGPLDTRPASHRRLLACSPTKPQREQTREVLSRFLLGAYRRPATDDELERLATLAESAQSNGESWEASIQLAMQATLCSPKFLFRVELDDRPQSPVVRPLDEFQLASRLSYFLWSSMPDEELLALAAKKQLSANLDAQARRMLADPKASALVENFALQWLQVKRLEWVAPDGKRFPQFNDKLRHAMLRETKLFFESVMREDRSVLDLIDADYAYLNEPLARHYGIADTAGNRIGQKPTRPGGKRIRGEGFQRVSLADRQRGGLITQASVLTVTSNPTRTSPVKRGRWVLEQILGEPPPEPPPNVPELPEDEQAVRGGTLRERMEAHRRNPSCANCHAKMDAIGFALENFDAVGAFRLKDGEFDIDASGTFPDGLAFQGPEELKRVVKQKPELFARCLTEKMLIYALGRGLEHYDRPTVEGILQALVKQDYTFSALVSAIANSDAFRLRRGGF